MEWFKNTFLLSFGECTSKRITEKQADIFKRYLKKQDQCLLSQKATSYVKIIDNKKIELSCQNRKYWITIQPIKKDNQGEKTTLIGEILNLVEWTEQEIIDIKKMDVKNLQCLYNGLI